MQQIRYKILNKYFLVLIFAAVAVSAFVIGTSFGTSNTPIQWPNIHQNVETDFNPQIKSPSIQDSSYINAFAVVIGDCHIGKMVLMAPTAVCRGDEGTPIYVSDYSNIQEGVVLHALETTLDGKNLDARRFSENGDRLLANDSRFDSGYAIFIGSKTSLAHDSMVHGPAWIGNNTFIGMKSLIFDAKIGNNVAVGVYSLVTNGVVISDNKFVPPGSKILTQAQADALPSRIGSSYENINKAVLHVNKDLADAYNQNDLGKIKYYREALMEEEGLVTTQPLP